MEWLYYYSVGLRQHRQDVGKEGFYQLGCRDVIKRCCCATQELNGCGSDGGQHARGVCYIEAALTRKLDLRPGKVATDNHRQRIPGRRRLHFHLHDSSLRNG